jgi:hypothetical protein
MTTPTPVSRTATDWTTVAEEDRMRYAVDRLVAGYGYPVEAAAGIVGNLYAESTVIPNRIEDSTAARPMRARDFGGALRTFTAAEVESRDEKERRGPARPGVGLAQWSFPTRRAGLFAHAFRGSVLGADVLFDMDAQLDYLETELSRDFPALRARLRAPGVAVDDASDDVVFEFERPGSILDGQGNRLPRTDPTVRQVFAARRAPSRRALATVTTRP